jgi:hypothetical protein
MEQQKVFKVRCINSARSENTGRMGKFRLELGKIYSAIKPDGDSCCYKILEDPRESALWYRGLFERIKETVQKKDHLMEQQKTFKVRCIDTRNTGSAGGFGIEVGKTYLAFESEDGLFYYLLEDPGYQSRSATWSKHLFERIEGINIAFVQQEGIATAMITALSSEFRGHIFQYEDDAGYYRIFYNDELTLVRRAEIFAFARGFLAALP